MYFLRNTIIYYSAFLFHCWKCLMCKYSVVPALSASEMNNLTKESSVCWTLLFSLYRESPTLLAGLGARQNFQENVLSITGTALSRCPCRREIPLICGNVDESRACRGELAANFARARFGNQAYGFERMSTWDLHGRGDLVYGEFCVWRMRLMWGWHRDTVFINSLGLGLRTKGWGLGFTNTVNKASVLVLLVLV